MRPPSPGPSPIHGTGLFARDTHRAGDILCQYSGRKVSAPPPPDSSGLTFGFELSEGSWIDGSDPDNLARHANHSCEPSTEAVREGDSIMLVAIRDLQPGEELTFDYGFGLADCLAHPCHCGSKGCPGRIIAAPLRPLLRRQKLGRTTGD